LAARRTTADRLRRRLRGDLDLIVLKALEKDPARRYQSANQLLDDIDRHLGGRPVRARPATRAYRLGKFVRRHHVGLAAAAAVVLLLAGLAGFHSRRITGERDRARLEAEKARASTEFLQRLLGDAYPSVALGDSFSMGELLARAEARIDSLPARPELQAELLRTVGDVYREQGRFSDALRLIERAVALHRRSDDPRSLAAGNALSALGHIHHQMVDYEAALQAHREELEIFQALVPADDSLVLYAMNNVAVSAAKLELFDEALALYREVLARRRRLFGDSSALVHTTLNNLGDLHSLMGNAEEAERHFREALAIRQAVLSPDHPSTALTRNNLATVLKTQNRLAEAESLARESLAGSRRVFGPEHPQVGLAAYNLASLLRKTGRLAEAESLYRLTVDIDRKALGDDHLEVGIDLSGLGRFLGENGNCVPAVATLQEAQMIFDRHELPPDHSRQINNRGALGACLTTLGRFAEAEPLLVGSYQGARTADSSAASAAVRAALERLVGLYQAWGRGDDAAAHRALLAGLPPGS
ncbi:MAG TPA: tetratricopeptide repeat protein, partial [Gemmatimonadales bacterium]|nr:tetratricopeptide repeat protein [Gemmatimonadales bacterium]